MRNSLSFICVVVVACGAPRVDSSSHSANNRRAVLRGPECMNTVETVPNEQRFHISESQTPVYQHNPPVSGQHYPIWARWQANDQIVARGYWVHNLEHGGVIFLYRPDAPQEIIDALNRVFNSIPLEQDCVDQGLPHARALLTPDPLIDTNWAVTVSGPEDLEGGDFGVGYVISANCIQSEQALVDFAVAHRNMSAETICDQGFVP